MAEGEVKPVKLPPERELAEKFKMSRRAVRLAMDLLEKRNLVDRRHGSGNYLLPKKFAMNGAYVLIPAEVKEREAFYAPLVGRLMLYAREHGITLVPVRPEEGVLVNKDWPGIVLPGVGVERVREAAAGLRAVVRLIAPADSRFHCYASRGKRKSRRVERGEKREEENVQHSTLEIRDEEGWCWIGFDDWGIGREAATAVGGVWASTPADPADSGFLRSCAR